MKASMLIRIQQRVAEIRDAREEARINDNWEGLNDLLLNHYRDTLYELAGSGGGKEIRLLARESLEVDSGRRHKWQTDRDDGRWWLALPTGDDERKLMKRHSAVSISDEQVIADKEHFMEMAHRTEGYERMQTQFKETIEAIKKEMNND